MKRLMIFTMHGTTPWWSYLGSRMTFAETTVLGDTRGDGDIDVVDDFYRYFRSGEAAKAGLAAYGDAGVNDIIRRCRVLRGIDRPRALAMVGAMHQAVSNVFDRIRPDVCLSFTIDRYVMDLIGRIAEARGVRFIEMTTSILPDEVMLMERGRLRQLWQPSDAEVDQRTKILHAPDFAPSYVRNTKRFGRARYWQVYGYFALRGAAFNAIRHWQRDPLNLHYLDAQKSLPHKVRLGDVAVLDALDAGWQKRLDAVAKEKRVFLGLQLFPEASLDYWLRDPAMLDHDDVIVRYVRAVERAGYHVFVKDHPLQFGFRQRELIDRLRAEPNVTLLPYDVPATLLIAHCGVSITQTGTIGFQAALAGLCSVVTEPYYAIDDHYVHVLKADAIDTVAERIAAWRRPDDMDAARRELVRKLTAGSVPGNYFAFRKFDKENLPQRQSTEPLVESLNKYLPQFARN